MKELERRKASVVERWYLARTRAGAIPLVHVGFHLILPHPLFPWEIQASLARPLTRLPEVHPFLSSRVQGYESDSPELYLVEDEFTTDEVLQIEEGSSFEEALGEQLERHFPTEGGRLWHTWVFLSPSHRTPEGGYREAYVGMNIHHAIADGVAVCGVARTLVLLINNPDLTLPLPEAGRGLPIPMEEKISIRPSLFTTLGALYGAYVAPHVPGFVKSLYAPRTVAWEGPKPASPSPSPATASPAEEAPANPLQTTSIPSRAKSSHHIIHLPPSQLNRLLALCRSNGTTLTALLHTLMFLALSPLVDPSKQHIYTSVPASLLPLLFPSSNSNPQNAPVGGCYVAPFHYRAPPVAFPRTLGEFWALCKPYTNFLKDQRELQKGIEQWGLVALLSYPSLVKFWKSKSRSPGGQNSFAISNLRNVAFGKDEVGGGWVPRGAVFTQPMGGSSATLLADVISCSVEGCESREGQGEGEEVGGCTIVFGWEEGLGGEIVRGVIDRTREGWEWVLREAEKEGQMSA